MHYSNEVIKTTEDNDCETKDLAKQKWRKKVENNKLQEQKLCES